jgi:hypothetical protein
MPTTVQVIISSPTHVPKGSDHQPLDGGQPGNSPGRSSPGGYLLEEPPFDPPVGSFGWPALDPHTFIPPWYQLPIM